MLGSSSFGDTNFEIKSLSNVELTIVVLSLSFIYLEFSDDDLFGAFLALSNLTLGSKFCVLAAKLLLSLILVVFRTARD